MIASIFSELNGNNITSFFGLNSVLDAWNSYGLTYLRRVFKFYGYEIQTPFLWNNGNTLSTSTVL